MKKITFLIGAVLLSLNTSIAQKEQPAEKLKSKCTLVFEDAYEKVEKNYAGWHEKTGSNKDKKKFDKLTKETRERVRNVNEPAECYFMMNDWLSFFEDGHLFINIPEPYTKPEPEEERAKRAARTASVSYRSEEQFRKFLDSKPNQHELVGIWETEDKNYRLGMIEEGKGEFTAFLMEAKDELWTAGKSKFTLSEKYKDHYEAEYRYFDFTAETKFARHIKDYLVIEGIYKMKKVYPKPQTIVSNVDILTKLPDYRVEQIDDKTVLITLPPFTMYDSDDVIMAMVTKYSPLISSTENLIVDLRNNPGGNENAFAALYPYIADKPIVRKGGMFRSSEDNIVLLSHELESIQTDPKFKRILAPKLNKVISLMKNNPNGYVQGPDKVFQYVKPSAYPKKVAILVNENTASTAESVTLEAKQSDKTIVIGTRTKGLADYIEVRDWGLPAFGWRLAIGMAKSMRDQDIDNKGIKPDVKVPSNEVDWVGFATEYLSKR
ncbi:S41 family peptidase [Jiulongibacter sediminis]|jgi:hypothetical protein|uniref:S41 family peptidase n=1 Tax=Jiulongibacter sediminis TaxID=1605367 RepID=UPI0026E953CF|nr:S41 family peptidase [Jiulongibacter sediminis]